MARKKKHEEHENLERWLVSYADFMTLLFATFVVLYALNQTTVVEMKKVEDSLKRAFSASFILDNGAGVMNDGTSILENSSADSIIDTLLMEYISPKYEQESFKQIKKEIEDKVKSGELKDISAKIDDRGLVITITDNNIFFKSASAELSENSKKVLDQIGKLIVEKFAMHSIRVDGHTDALPITGTKYPSNWELSSARSSTIVRYLIDKFHILPDLMTAVGYAETRPLEKGNDPKALAKNRRVEIVVLKNINNKLENYQNTYLKMSKTEQQRRRNEQIKIIKELENKELQSLGEDIIHSSELTGGKTSTYDGGGDFLDEAKRLERLSAPRK